MSVEFYFLIFGKSLMESSEFNISITLRKLDERSSF